MVTTPASEDETGSPKLAAISIPRCPDQKSFPEIQCCGTGQMKFNPPTGPDPQAVPPTFAVPDLPRATVGTIHWTNSRCPPGIMTKVSGLTTGLVKSMSFPGQLRISSTLALNFGATVFKVIPSWHFLYTPSVGGM